jgi:thiamine-phosphate pyrophosphorylase
MTSPPAALPSGATEARARLAERLPVYGITPPDGSEASLLLQCEEALAAGLRVLQLRRPNASADTLLTLGRALRPVCDRHDALLIINDHVDIALAVGADGVHLGAKDGSIGRARLLAPALLIGASARTVERAERVVRDGADYVGTGPVWDARATKPDAPAAVGTERLTEVRAALDALVADTRDARRLLVAIGGIDATTAPLALRAGADGVAMVRGTFGHGSVATTVRSALRALGCADT